MIDKFNGEYAFLSNFYECSVTYDGLTYPSSEAAYQAQKCENPEERKQFTTLTPMWAKKLGRKINLRSDWESVKPFVMENIVFEKFLQHPELKEKLMATGDTELVEGNYWHDTYWGVCNGKGDNRLGKILMIVRASLNTENQP